MTGPKGPENISISFVRVYEGIERGNQGDSAPVGGGVVTDWLSKVTAPNFFWKMTPPSPSVSNCMFLNVPKAFPNGREGLLFRTVFEFSEEDSSSEKMTQVSGRFFKS